MAAEGGTKKDTGKPRISLIPVEALEGITQALMFGANKYGDYNYRSGLKQVRIFDSILRHGFSWLKGEDHDKESGLKHLHHMGAGICMLIWMNDHRPDLDDRYKKEVITNE